MKKARKKVAAKKKGKRMLTKTPKKPKKRSIFDLPIPKSSDWKAEWDDDGGDFSDET